MSKIVASHAGLASEIETVENVSDLWITGLPEKRFVNRGGCTVSAH